METVSDRGKQYVYYGRGQGDVASQMQSPMPTAEFINSKSAKLAPVHRPAITNTQPAPHRRSIRPDEEPTQAMVMAESDSGSQKRIAKEFRPAEYDLEERMNHNLMKQFKGMFASDEAGRPDGSRQGVTPMIYNFIHDQDASSDDCGVQDLVR